MKNYLFAGVLCVFLSGCLVAPFVVSPIVTGVLMWKQGEARKYYKEDLRQVNRAVRLSLKELGHQISSEEQTEDGYSLVAGSDDKFKIKIVKIKQNITEVKCRINIMGDKPYAELLYAEIDAHTDVVDFDDEGRPTKSRRRLRPLQN